MANTVASPLIGVGIYSIADAARLAGMHPQRVSRWMKGYRYKHDESEHRSPPIWQNQHEMIEGKLSLGFLDLMEIRFVNAFLDYGVSLQSVRKAVQVAAELLAADHPFCTERFKTDGRSIFMEVQEDTEDSELLDLIQRQFAFEKVLKPYLVGIEYEAGDIARWWPMGKSRRVLVDPDRQFGQPVASESNVPTRLLARAAAREGVDATAGWFEVTKREVRDAIEFEERIAA